jgi:hypothetical protein
MFLLWAVGGRRPQQRITGPVAFSPQLMFFVLNYTLTCIAVLEYGLPSNGLPPIEGASKAYCETVSKQALSLIDGMLTIDVGLRYSLEDVIGCQWLRDEDTMAQLRERVFKETPIF